MLPELTSTQKTYFYKYLHPRKSKYKKEEAKDLELDVSSMIKNASLTHLTDPEELQYLTQAFSSVSFKAVSQYENMDQDGEIAMFDNIIEAAKDYNRYAIRTIKKLPKKEQDEKRMELKMLESLTKLYNLNSIDLSEKIDKFDDLITMSKVLERYEKEKINDVKEINTESFFEKFIDANDGKLPSFLYLTVKSKYANDDFSVDYDSSFDLIYNKILQKPKSERKNILNSQDNKGNTLLHIAIKNNDYDLARILCKNKDIDINKANMEGDTPLHVAAKGKNPRLVEMLMDEKASVTLCNGAGKTVFACGKNNRDKDMRDFCSLNENFVYIKNETTPFETITDLMHEISLEKKMMMMDPQENKGSMVSNAITATWSYLTPSLNYFMPNFQTSPQQKIDDKISSLHSLINIFLKLDPKNVSASNKKGNTLLHLAVQEDMPETAQLLLEKNADVNAKNAHHKNPSYYTKYAHSYNKENFQNVFKDHSVTVTDAKEKKSNFTEKENFARSTRNTSKPIHR